MSKREFIVKYICEESEYERLVKYLIDNQFHISSELIQSKEFGINTTEETK